MRVVYDAEDQAWSIIWRNLLLHFCLKDEGLLADYFGPSPSEGPGTFAGLEVFDPLTVTRATAGVQLGPSKRPVLWSLSDWEQRDSETFAINLQAADLPLRAKLRISTDPETGIVRHQAALEHTGEGPEMEISDAISMSVLLPPDVREVVHLAGRWGAEAQVQRLELPKTALLLESRSGKAGFQFAPYVAFLAPDHTYFTELFWSGNWQYYIRRQSDGRVLVSGGLNSWGLRHRLSGGATLVLPDMVLGCAEGGLDHATQQLHLYRRRRRPDPDLPVPVQFNSWFPCQGEPPVETMKAYAARASELGCEVFVLDAGWYTTEKADPSADWWLRTGDWVANRGLFPNGLEELSGFCREHDIDFGIWMEPEAVGPNARVRSEHPEWLHAIGGQVTPPDQRGVLNLGVPAARAWIRDRIVGLLRATQARWLKWDFNADLFQGGWAPSLQEELSWQDPLVAHYEGLYALQDDIRATMPNLVLEMCSSGGGRQDAALLSHAHTYWISDQTHPLMKLAIHFGCQLAHPPEQCNDWLVEWPPHQAQYDALRMAGGEYGDLRFRLHVAMLGSFGISAPVERWGEEDVTIVKAQVAWYKQTVRPVVQAGRQYLLTEAPPLDGNGDWAAVWYVLPEGTQGVLFAFRLANGEASRTFALPGLRVSSTYSLRSPDGWSATATGSELQSGLVLEAEEPFRSVAIQVEVAEGGTNR